MSWKYNPNSILSLSNKRSYTTQTGEALIRALYPLQKLEPTREISYVTMFTPIKDTAFQNMI